MNVGSFVEVPMRGRPVVGLVTHVLETSEYDRVKDVTRLMDMPALRPEDVFFYELLAQRTYQSLGSVLYAALPLPPKRATTPKPLTITAESFAVSQEDVLTLRSLLQHVTSKTHTRAVLPNDRVGFGVVLGLLKTTQDPLLVLVPDVHMAHELARLAKTVTDSISLVIAKQSKSQAYAAWEGLRTGSVRVTIGTRKAALMTPSESTRIVMLGCGEDDFAQWDQNPHYDARWCLKVRAATHANPTAQLGVLPRIEDGDISGDGWRTPPVEIVNMDEGVKLSEHYLLSNQAMAMLQTIDTRTKPLLVFYNRLDKQENADYVGGASLATLLRERLEGVSVTHVTSEGQLPTSGVAVVTRTLLYNWSYLRPELAGLIVLRPEHNLIYRGFRSLEQASRELRRLVSWAATAHAPCLVQAKEPDVVRRMLGGTPELWQVELQMRKTLGYPPYAELHVAKAKDAASQELLESYRAQHADALGTTDLVVRRPAGKPIAEWLTWPPSCDIFVSPDSIDL